MRFFVLSLACFFSAFWLWRSQNKADTDSITTPLSTNEQKPPFQQTLTPLSENPTSKWEKKARDVLAQFNTKFTMPSLGADMDEGTIVSWLIKPGDTVSRGDIIAEVETQKGVIEIEVWESGVVSEILVHEGHEVPVGEPLAIIEGGEASEKGSEIKEAPKVVGATEPTKKPKEVHHDIGPSILEGLELRLWRES